MSSYPYDATILEGLRAVLSPARMGPYLAQGNGDLERAMQLYTWNAALASGLHGPLHVLEITLRNSVHQQLAGAFGANWVDSPDLLRQSEMGMVVDARKFLDQRSEQATPDKLVAEVSFRFWVGMFTRKYDRLWTSQLQALFSPRPKRDQLHEKLDRLRTLRNRVAHHEPILHRNLMSDLGDIKDIVGSISPTALDWLTWHEQATIRFGTSAKLTDLF